MNLKMLILSGLIASSAFAHFGVVKAEKSADESEINLNLSFIHPFEQEFMNLEKPQKVAVFDGEKSQDLADLKAEKNGENGYFKANYKVAKPGVYQFFMEPAPYFEPAEEKFIKHITKTVVNTHGFGEGWDKAVGLKAEIVPLSRPFGLYAGNIFSGKVLYKGKPASGITVEVEYYNESGLKAPSEDHITQEVMTNENGEFSFAMPKSGWWGFAALIDDDETIEKDGKKYPIELGGVIWVKTDDYK